MYIYLNQAEDAVFDLFLEKQLFECVILIMLGSFQGVFVWLIE